MLAQLQGETDFAGFRAQARALLARRVLPQQVQWSTSAHHEDLFAQHDSAAHGEPSQPLVAYEPSAGVPASFLALCETVVLHSDAQRFTLLYRLLWRLVHEPALRHDPLDADMLQAQQLAHAVRRDMHKMRAFVRFREVPTPDAPGGVLHVAWFEPGHHIVEANAPWFMRRFTQMHWAILTPRRCVSWNGQELQFAPGAQRSQAPAADNGERLWLTYYQSIFNPARLKLAMMRKEMPRKYWRNLPEARLISTLAAQAGLQSGTMIEQPPTQPLRRIPDTGSRLRAITVTGLASAPSRDIAPDQLAQAMQDCRACPIGHTATQAVPGEGPMRPDLMFVGEQPGDQEDLAGRPFVGPAGRLLDRALQSCGLSREAVFMTNAVRHFKYELRGRRRIHKTPSQHEAAACAPWLDREIAHVQPRALVALGSTAARSLLRRPVAVVTERGQWHARPDGLPVLVTLHPAALLRMPPDQQAAAFDLFVGDLGRAAGGPPTRS
jgi:probable DNA metabolism protein